MKTNKILRIKSVNGGDMLTIVFALPVGAFDTDQIGGTVLNMMDNEVNVLETTLSVGDSITDEVGGEPIIAAVHGKVEAVEINNRPASDYRDAFGQKMSGEGER